LTAAQGPVTIVTVTGLSSRHIFHENEPGDPGDGKGTVLNRVGSQPRS
jgi:hypothetical protein